MNPLLEMILAGVNPWPDNDPPPVSDDPDLAAAAMREVGAIPMDVPSVPSAGRTRRPRRAYRSGVKGPTKGGKIIGTPHKGTHTVGNWQSDNAIDLGVPKGSPVYAARSGRIAKTGGRPGTDRFGGYNITLDGGSDQLFYTHLVKALVKPGQRVRRGQVIGRSGVANSVPHLHFASRRGNPKRYVG